MSGTPRRLGSLITAKLGRCPRCMRSSILGTMVGWPVVVSIWLLDPPGPYGLLPVVALALTLAFTLLMLAHLGVFTRRVLLATPGSDALNRRQFISNAMGIGVAVFASALFGPSCRRPSPTESAASLDAAGASADMTAAEPSLDSCAVCLDGCVRSFSTCRETAQSSEERAECVVVFQRCQERCRVVGAPCFVAAEPAPNPRCSPLSGNICDPVKANITAARCQAQCNPGTPQCRLVAPNDICEGRLRGPIFVRRAGRRELFCQWCACVCGTFVPGG